MKRSKRIISLTMASAVLFGSVLLTGCGATQNKYMDSDVAADSLAVTIGKDEITIEDMKAFITLSEINYELSNISNHSYYQMFYSQMGLSYDQEYKSAFESVIEQDEDGKDVLGSTYYRDMTMDQFCEIYIINKEAKADIEEGKIKVEITDDMEAKFEKNAEEMLDTFSDNMKKKADLSKEQLVEYQKEQYVYLQYYEYLIDGFDVTKDDVKDDYDYNNVYRQYKTNYVSMPVATYDDEGNQIDFSEEEKAEVMKTMKSVLADLKSGKSIDDVCTYTEKLVTAEELKTYQQSDAYPEKVPVEEEETTEETTEEGETATEDTEVAEPTTDEYMINTRTLKNGQYSDVFEYNGSYYIAYMEDNNSTELYDEAIESGIASLEVEKYDAYYAELKEAEEYKITVNDKVWDEMLFGDIVIVEDELLKSFGLLK